MFEVHFERPARHKKQIVYCNADHVFMHVEADITVVHKPVPADHSAKVSLQQDLKDQVAECSFV